MSGKNTEVFGIDPTHDSADAAVDALRASRFRRTDISVLGPQNVGSKDPVSARGTPLSASPARMPARTVTPAPAAMPAPNPTPATAPSASFMPFSWPNSGFRNSRRRGTKGG